MIEQLVKLREAIRSSNNIQEATMNIEPLASELGYKYEEFKLEMPRYEKERKLIEREYNVSLPESIDYCYRISFAEPFPASEFCDGVGWKRAYAVSGDIYHTTWHIEVPESDLEDHRYIPSSPISDTLDKSLWMRWPRLGEWSIHAWLKGRPKGEIAGVSGASPTYDLRVCSEDVTRIEAYPLFLFYFGY